MPKSRRSRKRARRTARAVDNVIPVDRLEQQRMARSEGDGAQSKLRLTDVEDIASRRLEGFEDGSLSQRLAAATALGDDDPLTPSEETGSPAGIAKPLDTAAGAERTPGEPMRLDADADTAGPSDGTAPAEAGDDETMSASDESYVSLTRAAIEPAESGSSSDEAENSDETFWGEAEMPRTPLPSLTEVPRDASESPASADKTDVEGDETGAPAGAGSTFPPSAPDLPSSEATSLANLAGGRDAHLPGEAETAGDAPDVPAGRPAGLAPAGEPDESDVAEAVRSALRGVLDDASAPAEEPARPSDGETTPMAAADMPGEAGGAGEPPAADAPTEPLAEPAGADAAHERIATAEAGAPEVGRDAEGQSEPGAEPFPEPEGVEGAPLRTAPEEPETALQRATEQLESVLRAQPNDVPEPLSAGAAATQAADGEGWPHERAEEAHTMGDPNFPGDRDLSPHGGRGTPSDLTTHLDDGPPPIVRPDLTRTPSQPRFGGGAAMGLVGGLILAGVVGGAVYFLAGEPATETPATNPAPLASTGPDRVAAGPPALAVGDVSGEAGRAVTMDLRVSALDPARGALVRISGLPHGAKLSDGFAVGDGTWLVPQAKAHDLYLTLPENVTGELALAAGIVESDGKTRITDVKPFRVRIRGGQAAVQASAADNLPAAAAPAPAVKPQPRVVTTREVTAAAPVPAAPAAPAAGEVSSALPPTDATPPEGMSLADLPPGVQEELVPIIPNVPAAPSGGNSSAVTVPEAIQPPAPTPQPASPSALAPALEPEAAQPDTDDDEELGGLPSDIKGLSAPTQADIAAAPKINRQRRAALSSGPVVPDPGRPETASPPAPSASAIVKAKEHIRRGDRLMRNGDVAGARKLYLDAARFSAPHAALALGRSYDPNYFRRIKSPNAKPDAATALQWYRKAVAGGLPSAQVKIARLLKTMGQ